MAISKSKQQRRKGEPPVRRLLTRAELASCLGVTPSAIDGYVRRGCPVAERGRGPGRGNGMRFFLPDVADWRHVRRALRKQSTDPDSMAGIRLRLARAQAEMAEISLARRRDEYVTVDAAARAKHAATQRIKAILLEFLPRHARASVGVTSMSEGIQRHEALVQETLELISIADDLPDPIFCGQDSTPAGDTPVHAPTDRPAHLRIEDTP